MSTSFLNASPSKAFPSKYDGKCANQSCAFPNGAIRVGQLIRWSRGQKPAKVWHDGACYESRYLTTPTTTPTPTPTPTPTTTQRLDTDVAISPSSDLRANGPLFDDSRPVALFSTSPKPTPANSPSSAKPDSFLASLADQLAPYLDDRLQSLTDADQVRDIVSELLGSAVLKSVISVEIIDYSNDTIKDLGLQHKDFPDLLRVCNSRVASGHRVNVWLTGPAGSGKTTAAENVALALNLSFGFCGSQDNPYGLMGFIDATGNYRRTWFRDIYEHGGVALLDEIDSWTNAAIVPFNAAIANGSCQFPDGLVRRHKDCVIIAAANTWGLGANSDYVGRVKLDGAALDRFVQMSWGIDEALELATAGNPAWTKRVQSLRASALLKGVKTIISPRASYFGAGMLASGMDQAKVEAMTIRKAMTDDQWGMVCGGAR